ncbi:peptidoglycan recognition protein family protein [Mucilaginibacter agri]|uniref:N-acetylmuramoyl-L-alanine amidase n=1 Tax=Mucilaginibacter agri TaxID=2695265 RepID=A0A966DUG8_9SPHI|nr:peptidoglycan recognition family protein [Mucilaginibacter agri]NCD71725.1 hypothetical protein [Mucilaginibacter agri]
MAEHLDSELVTQLKKLIEKLDKPKKDIYTWVGLATSFFSTVVIAGLSLYFSNKESARSYEYNIRQMEMQKAASSQQLELQKANLKLEEMKVLNSLIPAISSKNISEKVATLNLLKAFNVPYNATGVTKVTDKKEPVKGSGVLIAENKDNNVFLATNKFLELLLATAQSPDKSTSNRQEALLKASKLLMSHKTTPQLKDKAISVFTTIAASANEPAALKQTAFDILKDIKNIPYEQLAPMILKENITRQINTIIIHHTGAPFSLSNYSADKIFTIANFQKSELKWNKASWHYLIAPDGTVWTGVDLNLSAIHAGRFNKASISVCFYVDGEKELPTTAQMSTFRNLTNLLTTKFKLPADSIIPHRNLPPHFKSCPGKLITDTFLKDQLTSSNLGGKRSRQVSLLY